MAKYRHDLPQLRHDAFLSDGGMETTLIFQEGLDLPHFASFPLLATPEGRRRLKGYYAKHLTIAHRRHVGFILDTPTWRASSDWGALLGYDAAALHKVNSDAVTFLEGLRTTWEGPQTPCHRTRLSRPEGLG